MAVLEASGERPSASPALYVNPHRVCILLLFLHTLSGRAALSHPTPMPLLPALLSTPTWLISILAYPHCLNK